MGDSCTVPYSCLAVAAPLVARGYPVEILDEFATRDFDSRLAASTRQADIVGISCFTGHQIDRATAAARRIRELRPELPIVWGGYHPSLYPQLTAESALSDYVVTGQGEWMLLDLVERMARGESPAETPGVWRKIGGVPHKNPGGPSFRTLDEFPAFPFDLVPLKSFLIDSLTPRSISYHSSLGCPFRCNFCTVTEIYERRWSGFSPERVLRDVRFLVEETGAQSVEFYDNNFFVNDRRTFEIARGLHDARLGILWSGEARPDKIAEYDDEMLSLLARSGLRWVFIGAESGHDRVLEMMERDHGVSHILEAARKLARHRIKVTFSFNLGYPQEPPDNFARTDALCRELCAMNPETEIMVYITTAYEATPSFHRAKELAEQADQPHPGSPAAASPAAVAAAGSAVATSSTPVPSKPRKGPVLPIAGANGAGKNDVSKNGVSKNGVSTNGVGTNGASANGAAKTSKTLEDWKHLDQRKGDQKSWLDPRYGKKLHNFSLATFYATSFLHRKWRKKHRRNPFVGLLGALADLHMRVGYYDSILDLRILNKLFMKTSRPARKAKVDMWSGR
jgi:radical SAM superfamily enzyme YgiQ (UPF0313 family)